MTRRLVLDTTGIPPGMLIASDSLHPDLVLATKILAEKAWEPGDMILVVRRGDVETDIAICVHQGKSARVNFPEGRR